MNRDLVPQHLGIIMDGNRRWAKARGLPTLVGHKKGFEVAMKVGEWCLDRGVKILTIFAFSTENWQRSKKEVLYLMGLLKQALTKEVEQLHNKGIQLRVMGLKRGLSKEMLQAIESAMKRTKHNTRGILNIALNYGGRTEIVEAVKKIIHGRYRSSQVTEKLLSEKMLTAGFPDPDFIIRTSGEQRLSNFLTWQSVYSELYFTKKHWPEFSEKDLDRALAEYARRSRRFGGN